MAIHTYHNLGLAMALGLIGFALPACGPRVIISTGTTIGLKATPGDGNTRPPQVTFAYKRSELALVPTSGNKAKSNSDAFSTLAAIHFSTEWFGSTEIRSFLGTGMAARYIQGSEEGKSGTQGTQGTEAAKQSEFWETFECSAPAPGTQCTGSGGSGNNRILQQ